MLTREMYLEEAGDAFDPVNDTRRLAQPHHLRLLYPAEHSSFLQYMNIAK